MNESRIRVFFTSGQYVVFRDLVTSYVAKLRFGLVGRPRWAVIFFSCGPHFVRRVVGRFRARASLLSEPSGPGTVAKLGFGLVAHPSLGRHFFVVGRPRWAVC